MNIKGIKGMGKEDKKRSDGQATEVEYRFDLVDPEAMFAIARVMDEGEKKGYEKDGWKKVSCEDHINHALGHIYAHLAGEENEDHLSHALTQLMMAYGTQNTKVEVRRKRVYICHQFRDNPTVNYNRVRNIVRKLQDKYKDEYLFIVPHFLFQHLEEDTQRELILRMGLEALSMCDEIWVFGDHISDGMVGEINFARKHNIEIIYHNEGE